MGKYNKIVAGVIFVIFFAACCPTRYVHTHDIVTVRDTIVHYHLIRDTITVYSTDTLIIDETGQIKVEPIKVENDFSIAKAWIDNNRLFANLTNKFDSIPVEVQYEYRDRVVTEIVEVQKPIHWTVWLIIIILCLSVLLLILKR